MILLQYVRHFHLFYLFFSSIISNKKIRMQCYNEYENIKYNVINEDEYEEISNDETYIENEENEENEEYEEGEENDEGEENEKDMDEEYNTNPNDYPRWGDVINWRDPNYNEKELEEDRNDNLRVWWNQVCICGALCAYVIALTVSSYWF